MEIGYRKGCKCAYCRNNEEDPQCEEIHEFYRITSTGILGASCKYMEVQVKVPVCKSCSDKRSRSETPFMASECLIYVIAYVWAFWIAIDAGDGFWQGLVYCLPATLIAGIPAGILFGIGRLVTDGSTGPLRYKPIMFLKRYGFTDSRPSTQQTSPYDDQDWTSKEEKFYAELADLEKKLYSKDSEKWNTYPKKG